MALEFDIKGLNKVEAALTRFPINVEKKMLKKAMRFGAKAIVKEARSLAPRRTGRLAKSIGVVSGSRRDRGASLIVVARKGKKQKYDAWYSHLVEWGVPSRGIPARPFMRPAVDKQGAQYIKEFTMSLAKQIGDHVI